MGQPWHSPRCPKTVFCAALGKNALSGRAGLRCDRDAHRLRPDCGSGQTGCSRASHGRGCSQSTGSSGEVKRWDLASMPEAEFREAGSMIRFVPVTRGC